MEPVVLLQALMDVADAAELEVRVVGGSVPGDFAQAQASSVCRVKGNVWVVLVASDPVSEQIQVLANALKTHAAAHLGAHYLPPEVRLLLTGKTDSGF